MPCFHQLNPAIWLRPGYPAINGFRIPRSSTLVPPPRTFVVGPSCELGLRGGAGCEYPVQAFDTAERIHLPSPPQPLDPTLRCLNPSGFHGCSLRPKCWRYTGKSLETTLKAQSHQFLFTRLVGSLICRPCIATSRPGTGRLCGRRPTPFTCQSSSAIAIRSWRSFNFSTNSGDRDPDTGGKRCCVSSFRG